MSKEERRKLNIEEMSFPSSKEIAQSAKQPPKEEKTEPVNLDRPGESFYLHSDSSYY